MAPGLGQPPTKMGGKSQNDELIVLDNYFGSGRDFAAA